MATGYKYTDSVGTKVVVEQLNGSSVPEKYLDRFSESIYNTSPDSHLFKLIFTLLGPSGIGSLKSDMFNARAELEAAGFKNLTLEKFYGNVFKFFKIIEEGQDSFASETLVQSEWAKVEVKDASYRNRAIDYLHGVRLGTTPDGMNFAARSGLGKNVDIVENYQYLFDVHSDNPIGLDNYGQTDSTAEFTVLPNYSIDQSQTYTLSFSPAPDSGFCYFIKNNIQSNYILWANLDAYNIQLALKNLNVDAKVTGSKADGFLITLQSPTILEFGNELYASGVKTGTDFQSVVGYQDSQFIQNVLPRNRYDVDLALQYLKPVGTFVTYKDNQSSSKRQNWTSVFSTSSQVQVLKFVTGNASVDWPTVDGLYWIQGGVELEAPKKFADSIQHYQNFHAPTSIQASSYRQGNFVNFPYNISSNITENHGYNADHALADYTDIQTSRTSYKTFNGQRIGLIDGIYPIDYLNLKSVSRTSPANTFWASEDKESGFDTLEIDLGSTRAVNFVMFESLALPIDINIYYDITGEKSFVKITDEIYTSNIYKLFYDGQNHNPWEKLEYHFTDSIGNIIFTRYIKLEFNRRDESKSETPLFYNKFTEEKVAWPIVVRNLRLGRNV